MNFMRVDSGRPHWLGLKGSEQSQSHRSLQADRSSYKRSSLNWFCVQFSFSSLETIANGSLL